MAVFYNAGETKKRPGVYQRHSNVGFDSLSAAQDGICAIPVKANWGPVGKVLKNALASDLEKNYGSGEYSANYTVPAASAMFEGGASVVYTYRLGTGGTAASITLRDTADGAQDAVVITAKYPGSRAFTCSVRAKLSDPTVKEVLIYDGTKTVERFEIAAGGDEAAALVAAAEASQSFIVTRQGGYSGAGTLANVSNSAFTPGTNPTVANEDYSAAFAALEPYYYNTIALDVDDDTNMTLSLLLQSYLDSAYQMGKLGVAVVGEKTTVPFETRCVHAKAYNDAKAVYLGGGWDTVSGKRDGVMAICYTAGLIASTPTTQGITHTVIKGATDVLEALTYAQYEQAIDSGMLMVSLSPDGSVWYDTGINTLTAPDSDTQDAGWKKIRRVKIRFELIDRLDRELGPKVGKVSCDSDGVADIIQTGQRVLDAMANEGKLLSGATFTEDSSNPHGGDSAWFAIQADDIDSLEKIYLLYQFRYSQNA